MIKFSPLNKEINLFNRYTKEIKQIILKNINSETFIIPSMVSLLRDFPEMRDELLLSYDTSYSKQKDYNNVVDEEVKLFQAVMDEGMTFAYNIESKKLGIYTSRERTLNLIDKNHKYKKEKVAEKNKGGIIHCMRLDVSYVGDDESEVEIKATTRDKITPQTHFLIPFNVIHIIYKVIEGLLKTGKVLKIKQVTDGVVKERYLTQNKEELARHNAEGIVIADEAWYFGGVARMYAPVLGAPSYSVGLSRIDFLNIEKVDVVKINKDRLFTEVAKSTQENLYTQQIFSWILESLIDKSEERGRKFLDMLSEVPSIKEKCREVKKDNLEEYSGAILKATSRLKEEELEVVRSAFTLTYMNRLDLYKRVLPMYKRIPVPKDLMELVHLVQEGAYKFTLITSSNKLSVVYCSNDDKILTQIYGEGYLKRFDSIGNRIRAVQREIAAGGDEATLRKEYNIEPDRELEPPKIDFRGSDFVRVKLLFAAYTENSVIDFYRTIKPDRIISVAKLA